MKITKGVITAVALSLITITPAFAADPVGGTIVRGRVAKPNNKNIGVDVTCTHNGTPTTLHTTTGNNARYEVAFTLAQCSDGDTVTVHAANGANGTGTVHDRNPRKLIEINVGRINAFVPEFGAMTGLAALSVSAGSFFLLKKRFNPAL